jgi:hypothetical protein
MIDGLKVEPVSSYVFNNVTQDHSIHVKFEKIEKPSITIPSLKKYFITATAGEGGTITPEGNTMVYHRGNITFTIIPNDGYIILDVKVDGVSVEPLTTYTFSNVQKDHALHAEFVPCYKLTLESDNPEWGTVVGQAQDCYAESAVVDISATAKDGYLFSHWEAAPEGTFDNVNESNTTFTMPAGDVTVTAVFVQKPYNLDLKANNDEWGTVADLTNSPPYTEGTVVDISATAKDGYLFERWVADAGTFDDVNKSATFFTMPAQDVAVTAIFKEIVTIAGWDFEDGTKRNAVVTSGNISSYTPDEGNGTISLVGATFGGQQAGQYFTIGSGDKGFAAHSQHWHNDELSKYWQIEVSTLNYKNLKLSSKQRSSGTGPRDFIIEYSLDGSSWNDVAGGEIIVTDTFASKEVELPAECEGKSPLYLRWLMASNTSVVGGTVGAAGTNRIDDIILTGILID